MKSAWIYLPVSLQTDEACIKNTPATLICVEHQSVSGTDPTHTGMLAVLSRIVATEQSQAHLLENCSLRSLPYQTISGDSSLVHGLKMLELGLVIVNKECSFFLQSKNPIHYTVVFLFVCFFCLFKLHYLLQIHK